MTEEEKMKIALASPQAYRIGVEDGIEDGKDMQRRIDADEYGATMRMQKKILIEKACKWINERTRVDECRVGFALNEWITSIDTLDEIKEEYLKEFRKYMEE